MISEILDNSGFNTLIYDDPYAKICLITSIILEFQNNTEYQKKIAYIDLDAAFTSYAKAGLIPFIEIEKIDDDIYQSQSGGLKIYLPSKDILDFIVVDLIKSMEEYSLIIFDSINSFYNLFYDKIVPSSNNRLKIGSLNQLLYFFLMLILKHTSYFNIPFLVTSMIRYKRKGVVTSNRLLNKKSSLNFYVKMKNINDLSVTIMRHPKINQKNFIIKNKIPSWS
ncbi:MAG: hypothetical protein E6K94_04455 [Thaumarchaeota archaeon]|nr:MAG: hypothetical protein E6L01_01760 [Nitrososphaerota archaeon]TLX91271.1 MAG: hypothetical protein E6K94_04455 [Nitrososphaerota archaeon]